jgi:hypothetical protein
MTRIENIAPRYRVLFSRPTPYPSHVGVRPAAKNQTRPNLLDANRPAPTLSPIKM